MKIDIKYFYFNTPMSLFEYMRLKPADIPEDIIEHYNLRKNVTKDGYVYLEVRKGMYGLPHTGFLAQKLLEKRLNVKGYKQIPLSPGFWTHDSHPISFTLCVENFGVKYVGKQHAEHLMGVLRKFYTISYDWKGTSYLGINLDWDYELCKVHLYMINYVK